MSNGQTLQVRPKTFSLLLMFLQNPYQVLTKETLLETVWDDVQVNEQVLFQTIAELRKLFGDEQVIKTHPRKGYAWIVPVESLPVEPAQNSKTIEKTALNETLTAQVKTNGAISWLPGISIFVLCLTMIVYLVVDSGQTVSRADSSNLQGSLVILPVINHIQDSDHQWIYLGAMDQLVTMLKSTEKLAVMNTDYVLEIMKDADIVSTPQKQDIRRIFEVSGASLVVQTQLLGSTHDYQLKYTFHFRNDIKRGVIFENNINKALLQLVSKIAAYTGQSLSVSDHQLASEFGNEMLVRALELQEKRDHLGAVKLFKSLLQVEPDNSVARRLLAWSYFSLSHYDLAKTQLLEAIKRIEKSKSKNTAELPRIHYGLAFAQYLQNDFTKANEQILIADAFALSNNDWLYRAYIAQLQGMVNLATKQFEQAYVAYNNALTYHGVIQCPIGTSVTLLALSNVAKTEGNYAQAEQYFERAASIIDNRKLTLLKPMLATRRKNLDDNQ